LSQPVVDALDELGATPDEARAMLDAAQSVGLFRPGHLIEIELSILGEPCGELSQPLPGEPLPNGFAGSRAFAFQLPVFAGLHYVVNVTPDGVLWNQRIARPVGQASPVIETYDDLQPWRFVKDEVLTMLREHRMIDGFSFHEIWSGALDELPLARSRSVEVRFDFDLLQEAQDVSLK
jgi:hypothetical protein